MKLFVNNSSLIGCVAMPGSKSHTIRAVAIGSLASGKSTITRPLVSVDTLSAVDAYRALGADIDTSDDRVWLVEGCGADVNAPGEPIDVGNSGSTLRFAAGAAALGRVGEGIVLTGDDQICSRPIGPLLDSLNDLGASARSLNDNGMAPIEVSGRLKGGKTTLECVTSQYLTSLLLAVPLADGDTEITVPVLNEPDYVQITLDWLDRQGIKYENDDMRYFRISGGQKYKPFERKIPADFSSATFFLCAGAMLEADITLTGLDFSDSQPDKAVVGYLKAMGADISVESNVVRVKGSKLRGVTIDMNKTPDALPAMAVTAAFADGETRLVNVPQARSKETDRIACMCGELRKIGADVEELADGLVIRGSDGLHSAEVNGHHDHRIVMAMSLAGMALEGECVIETAEAMDVTFPNYVELMRSLGAAMKVD